MIETGFLSLVPSLLAYGDLAPLILRVILGIVVLDQGILMLKAERPRWRVTFETMRIPEADFAVSLAGVLHVLAGIALVIGLGTQPAAIVVALLSLLWLGAEYRDDAVVRRDIVFHCLILGIAASLALSGAGSFSLDLPL
jgi:uncharacterized membrane protein YphA (DoxX/SURF4 family)